MKRAELTERQSKVVNQLAAELSLRHRYDGNLIQQAIYFVSTQRPPNFTALQGWLQARLDAQEYFDRSKQTLIQSATTLALVEFLWEDLREASKSGTPNLETLSLMLGWIVRILRYYEVYPSKARAVFPDSANNQLYVPKPEIKPAKATPARRVDPPMIEPNEAHTRLADEFLRFMQQKNQNKKASD